MIDPLTRRAFVGSIAASALPIKSALASQKTLKMSVYLSSDHGFYKDVLTSWANAFKEKTNWQIDVQLFDENTAFGKIDRQADQVRSGVIDIAIGLNGIPRSRFPASSVIELPFLVEHADSGSRTLWQLYKEGLLGREYDHFKVLALFTHHGGLFHTINRPIRTLDDFKGLRFRTPSQPVSAMLKSLGALPINMPPNAIYENLQKGMLDGVIATWDLIHAIGANDIIKYHTNARSYVVGFHMLMNKRTYESLPEIIRQAIDEISGDAFVAKFGQWWDEWEKLAYEKAIERQHNIIEIDAATRREWKKQLHPMIQEYLQILEKKGVANAQKIYLRSQELITQFDAERN